MKEWATARAVIDKFDGYQSDIRKYGFTLITGLLAVTGLFSSSPSISYPPGAKFGVIASILVLVVALSYLDGLYRYLQRGAAIRARILESSLNLDLTNAIAEFLRVGRFESRYAILYGGFAVSTFVLGLAILTQAPGLELLLIVTFAVAIALMVELRPGEIIGLTDFSLDRKVVTGGQMVRITYTNLAGTWKQLFAASEKSQRKLWTQRLKSKRIKVFLLPTGEITGPRPVVGATTTPPSGDPMPLPPTKVEFVYLAQANWVWKTPADKPGLYDVRCYLQVSHSVDGVDSDKAAPGSDFWSVVQVVAPDPGTSPPGPGGHPPENRPVTP